MIDHSITPQNDGTFLAFTGTDFAVFVTREEAVQWLSERKSACTVRYGTFDSCEEYPWSADVAARLDVRTFSCTAQSA